MYLYSGDGFIIAKVVDYTIVLTFLSIYSSIFKADWANLSSYIYHQNDLNFISVEKQKICVCILCITYHTVL